jgi:hypothetical protein
MSTVVHTCDPNTSVEGGAQIQDQPRLHSRFQAGLGYIDPVSKNEKHCYNYKMF